MYYFSSLALVITGCGYLAHPSTTWAVLNAVAVGVATVEFTCILSRRRNRDGES